MTEKRSSSPILDGAVEWIKSICAKDSSIESKDNKKKTKNLFCLFGSHDWYYANFQTGKRYKFTNDHIGVSGRSCLNCDKKQKREKKKYIDVDSFYKEEYKIDAD